MFCAVSYCLKEDLFGKYQSEEINRLHVVESRAKIFDWVTIVACTGMFSARLFWLDYPAALTGAFPNQFTKLTAQ